MPGTELERTDPIEINPPAPKKDIRHLCRHIFADGRRCGSPSLRTQNFCYYHYAHRAHSVHGQDDRKRKIGFELNCHDGLDNATSIQLAIAQVASRVANNEIEPRRARALLYALQLAAQNLRNLRVAENSAPSPDIVEDLTFGHMAELEPGRSEPETYISRIQGRTKPFTSYDPPYEMTAEMKETLRVVEESRALNKPNSH